MGSPVPSAPSVPLTSRTTVQIVTAALCVLGVPALTVAGYNLLPMKRFLADDPGLVWGWTVYFLVALTLLGIYAWAFRTAKRALAPTIALGVVAAGSLVFSLLAGLLILVLSDEPSALPSPSFSPHWFENLFSLTVPVITSVQALVLLTARLVRGSRPTMVLSVIGFCVPPVALGTLTVFFLSTFA